MSAEFVPTAIAAADVPAGGLVVADVRGTKIDIANVGGTYYAFDDRCTHQQCSLADGDLAGNTVTFAPAWISNGCRTSLMTYARRHLLPPTDVVRKHESSSREDTCLMPE